MEESSTVGRSNINLNLCFTKIKFPHMFSQPTTLQTLPPTHQDIIVHHHNQTNKNNNQNLTILRSFNSLYEHTATASPDYSSTTATDFATAFASRRFFFSTPGLSNSIVDSTSSVGDVALVGNSVAVPKMSPDPYADFRRSMQEMLDARKVRPSSSTGSSSGGGGNWEFLHELLLCYLALNPKSTHKFIIGAFSDLVVTLLPGSGPR